MNAFILPEDNSIRSYVLATYYIELPSDESIVDKAKKMALGQTLGTWVDIPGISDEMQELYMGKVANILEAPPTELTSQIQGGRRVYFVEIAYPVANFGPDFPMLFTTLLGNDASGNIQRGINLRPCLPSVCREICPDGGSRYGNDKYALRGIPPYKTAIS